jgi:hypothetical protein
MAAQLLFEDIRDASIRFLTERDRMRQAFEMKTNSRMRLLSAAIDTE